MAIPLSNDINIPPIYSSIFNNIMTFSINNHNLYRTSHKKYDGVSHYFYSKKCRPFLCLNFIF